MPGVTSTSPAANLCYCGKPTSGATLCDRCSRTMAFAIANVAGHFEDLDTVVQKQARYGSAATKGSIGKAQPLPIDLRFVSGPPRLAAFGGQGGTAAAPGAQLRWDTRNTVVAWARTVLEGQRPLLGPVCAPTCLHTSCARARITRPPAADVRSMCHYLDKHYRWIETQAWAAQLLDEFCDLERRLTRMVNRPADRWYAGKCSAHDTLTGAVCEAELYASTDSGTLTCRACGTQHDVASRRDFLLVEAKDYLVTATEAAGALIAWTDYDGTETKLVDRIRKWRDRNQLEVRDVTSLLGKDRHLYRLGDIEELLVRRAQREQQRRIGA